MKVLCPVFPEWLDCGRAEHVALNLTTNYDNTSQKCIILKLLCLNMHLILL